MDHVLAVFRFTRFYAEKLVADLHDDEMTRLPHPGMNHPKWVLGHLILGADFIPKLLSEPMATDEAWMELFGPGSTPTDEPGRYPPKAALLAKLAEVYERGATLAAQADPRRLALPNRTPFFPEQFPTMGDLLTHLLSTHAAAHCGQLSAWRRCVGKASVLGV